MYFEKVKELIEKSTKRVLEKLEILHREIKDSIEKLNSLEECNNSLKIARKKSRTSITKLLAGLLGIVTPLSIVSFIKSESLASRFTLKEKLYETSTKTYSENNTESESYHKLMETITWEKLKDIPASRTLEVLGEVKIEDGKVQAIINLSENIRKLDGWEFSEDKLKIEKEFTNNVSYELPIVDYAGNKSIVNI